MVAGSGAAKKASGKKAFKTQGDAAAVAATVASIANVASIATAAAVQVEGEREIVEVVRERAVVSTRTGISKPPSAFRGVSWHKGANKWEARIRLKKVGGPTKYLGYFDDDVKAAKAYDQAVIDHDLDRGKLNFIGDVAQVQNGKSSDYKGVGKAKICGGHKWYARIMINSSRKHLGYFADEALAAKAYDAAVLDNNLDRQKYKLNFPPEVEHPVAAIAI